MQRIWCSCLAAAGLVVSAQGACLDVGSELAQAVRIDASSGEVTGWKSHGRELLSAPARFVATDEQTGESEGFKVRSVARRVSGVDVEAEAAKLGLSLTVSYRPLQSSAIRACCRLVSTRSADRAVTVRLTVPLGKGPWRYDHLWTPTGFDPVAPGKSSSQCSPFAGHGESQIPLGGLDNGRVHAVLAHSMREQRFVSYRGLVDGEGSALLEMSVALGLSPVPERFPDAADFAFVFLSPLGGTNVRGAFDAYYRTYPECFTTSAPQGGWALWLGPNDVAAAKRCGMANNEQEFETAEDPSSGVDASQRAGIAAMQYSEPWGMFMPFDKAWLKDHDRPAGSPAPAWCFKPYRREVDTKAYRHYLEADYGSTVESDRYPGLTRDMTARTLANAAIETEDGEWAFHGCGLDTTFPWTRNADRKSFASGFLMVNSSPWLPHPNRYDIQLNQIEYTARKLEKRGLRLDMVYLDSLCWGLGWNYYNFRRDHWRHATVPLTWAKVGGKAVPAMHAALHHAEFLKEFRKYCDAHGYAILGNSWDPVTAYCLGWLDALGCGEHVSSDLINPADLRIFRFLGRNKPLSTQDYRLSSAPEDEIERRLNRGLMYGVWSGTSDKWTQPDVVKRLLAMCPRYVALLNEINAVGWEVMTKASISPSGLIERWGGLEKGRLLFTVMNDGKEDASLTVTIRTDDFPGLGETCKVEEAVDGLPVSVKSREGVLTVSLQIRAGRTQLLRITR